MRLIRKTIRGKTRYFVQLILRGIPPKKHEYGPDTVVTGLDVGISTVAEVSINHVELHELGPDIPVIVLTANAMQGVRELYLEKGFVEFLSSLDKDDIKTEYLLPIIVDGMLKKNEVTVTVLDTDDKWFGVTYQEDKDAVKAALADLVAKGVYPENIK